MSSHHLDADTLLSIQIGCCMSREQYTQDPGPVIAQLREVAGDRTDLLAAEVGSWIGFYDDQWTPHAC